MPDTSSYKTSDLYYAAFLKVAGVVFLDATRDSDGRIQFAFENADNIRELKTLYFNRTAKVSAFEYANEIRAMKSMVHM